MILGHLIPAGTGFHIHQDSHVRIHDDAIREQEEAKARIMAARDDMLSDADLIARRQDDADERPRAPSLADLTPDESHHQLASIAPQLQVSRSQLQLRKHPGDLRPAAAS